ncbi:AgmX/PglI C-terminal domain-containing protein [bacterium]|nr:AgmX/PglI C-terminal domain-containing protein [bacterium]
MIYLLFLIVLSSCSHPAKNKRRSVNLSTRTQDLVGENIQEIRNCYNVELKKHSTIEGRIKLKWMIDHQGAIREVSEMENTTSNKKLSSCIQEEVKSWRYSETHLEEGSTATVEYPFLFKKN